MTAYKIDKRKHLAAFEKRKLSLSDWYVLSIPGQAPIPASEAAKVAAAQSVGDPRGEVKFADCQRSLLKLKAKGWLQIVTRRVRQSLEVKVRKSEYGFPLYGLPEVGDVDLTVEGAKHFGELMDELYGSFFLSEALIDRNGKKKQEIYAYHLPAIEEMVRDDFELKIERIRAWCIYWWNTFPSGFKVTISLRKAA